MPDQIHSEATFAERIAALNEEANALTIRAERAEARARWFEDALRRIAEEGPNRGLAPDFRTFAADALESAP